MQKVVTQMKRNQVVDSNTGRVDLRYNPMSVDEDYFIPVRGGQSTKIETLAGVNYTGDIDDVKYLKDKLFSAIKNSAVLHCLGEKVPTKIKQRWHRKIFVSPEQFKDFKGL